MGQTYSAEAIERVVTRRVATYWAWQRALRGAAACAPRTVEEAAA